MWPETESKLKGLMDTMSLKAANYNRTVKFGLRVHVIVRETEQGSSRLRRSINF